MSVFPSDASLSSTGRVDVDRISQGVGQLHCVYIRVFVCFFFSCALIRHRSVDDASARKRLSVEEWVFVCFSQRFPLGTGLGTLWFCSPEKGSVHSSP